jgi:very-short-patch-repair endonuclease
MEISKLKPRKALNKAFLKVKPNRKEIEGFKTNLIQLLDRSNDVESEEFHKNLVIDFLKKTYYDPNHFINTKGRNDLVIHNGNKAKSTVSVIIEAKKPTNKSEMVTTEKLNAKAFQELVLYYLRERITLNNLETKHLIITNINEWFIFDAITFDRLFAQNKKLVKQFLDFEGGRLADTKTDFFYKQIAEPFIDHILAPLPDGGAGCGIEFTHFNLQDYQKPLRNENKADDNKLIALFKLLSPEHLLKLPFTNDSNSLDKRFYSELLHIIGLTETKEKGKKLIGRNKAGERHTGTILENAIIQLDSLDKLSRLKKPGQFGSTQQEKLFNVGLELSITWINRILFLKLMEAQLISYHKGDKSYSFLNLDKIKNYDDLNSLFFQVLARKYDERNEDVINVFEKVPYLNSSLFEPTDIEQDTIFISNLRDDKTIPVISTTVLKDEKGKKRTGILTTLEYLFEFLNAYDFSSEGSEEIQEENKSLINASVLGLIFEKINGYKDGSFFTPGFITMYMCRETIRKAVVQKFNETKNWDCKSLEDLYDKIEDRQEANAIVNSLKICDPAVGSGHFLVSALNEMIAVKNDLKILQDRDGKRLKEYQVEVVNDELIVTDEEGELFDYNPRSKESQRIQETLFHEKQTIIENCLFGVDINANSVKICRLRLWIELLKNAYYKTNFTPGYSPPSQGGVPAAGGGGGLKTPWVHGSNTPPAGGLKHPAQAGGSTPGLNNLPYLKTFRKNLRNNLTPAEAKLWTMLKGRQLDGRKFRRQHSVANYILDFYCPEERLAIELDGQGHFEASQAEYDRERDLFLLHTGIKVLRFENRWVWDRPEALLDEVRKEFGWQEPPRPADTRGGNQPPRLGDTRGVQRREPPRPADTRAGIQPPRPADTPPWKGGELVELETLPNIDINIKCGNSLVSRFDIGADLKQALKKSKWTIDGYRVAVATYRNAQNKEQKREMERLIEDIKSDFETNIDTPFKGKLSKARGTVDKLATEINTQKQWGDKVSKKLIKDLEKADKTLKKLEAERDNRESNQIFENAFEWRFEFPEVLNDAGDFVGFDVVIGNPPYIRQEELKDSKAYLSDHYEVYAGTADLYVYFVERAFQVLKKAGAMSYIIPNKWMRAGYGTALRGYLKKQRIRQITDFGDLPVFEEATTYPCILEGEKAPPEHTFRAAEIKSLKFLDGLDFSYHMTPFEVLSAELRDEGWTLVPADVQKLLAKIRSKGTPLGEYVDGKIYRGVLTGLNEAFVIDRETRDKLIAEDPSSAEVIKPFLAGRDIKRYEQPRSDKFLIFTRRGIDINQYPTILNHLSQYRERLEPKPKDFKGKWPGRKQGTYKWYEIQDAVDYYEEFEKPKIMYQSFQVKPAFVFDDQGMFCNNSMWILPEADYVLLAILNSKVGWFLISNYCSAIQNGYQLIWKYLGAIPIALSGQEYRAMISTLVEKMINADSTDLKKQMAVEIDQVVYELFDLTEEEVAIIEQSI